jgi:hypothetical protein
MRTGIALTQPIQAVGRAECQPNPENVGQLRQFGFHRPNNDSALDRNLYKNGDRNLCRNVT